MEDWKKKEVLEFISESPDWQIKDSFEGQYLEDYYESVSTSIAFGTWFLKKKLKSFLKSIAVHIGNIRK